MHNIKTKFLMFRHGNDFFFFLPTNLASEIIDKYKVEVVENEGGITAYMPKAVYDELKQLLEKAETPRVIYVGDFRVIDVYLTDERPSSIDDSEVPE